MALIFKILKEEDFGLKKMLISRLVIVSGMVTLMSLYGATLMVGFSSDLPREWISNMVLNFIFAYLLQVLIARPFIGFVF
ncbi:DUF2798 domain-containing protein [Flavobacterium sp. W1B]|uniref:DUF2798 domain-containing protein n=1 Tax=Flavobacterium sp. W1B TaxID=3394146 RepID=UPI0039BD89A8